MLRWSRVRDVKSSARPKVRWYRDFIFYAIMMPLMIAAGIAIIYYKFIEPIYKKFVG